MDWPLLAKLGLGIGVLFGFDGSGAALIGTTFGGMTGGGGGKASVGSSFGESISKWQSASIKGKRKGLKIIQVHQCSCLLRSKEQPKNKKEGKRSM